MKVIGLLLAALALSAAVLASMTFVNESNDALRESNHWQHLESEKLSLGSLYAQGKLDRTGKRRLAAVYRQDGELDKSVALLRALWIEPASVEDFNKDAHELASLYSEMGAFDSALESYRSILAFNKKRLSFGDAQIGRDLSNLAVCQYLKACCQSEPLARRKELQKSLSLYLDARRFIVSADNLTAESRKQMLEVIDDNMKLARLDL
ncbi:MAG: hypothetical protein J0M35_21310 [Candidatus Obscuribacter phosphatis]|uniref:Tetratricopeptide repeat protein n=1 Tax=Candidatus Obscuribacter phosphatis TaxID=1906157 RepID=A0A8J7TNL6_9BACT|nr:hypothetical protein [Candidatus Obscuribacter phosphatis]